MEFNGDLSQLNVRTTKEHIEGPIVESKNKNPERVRAMLNEARRNAMGTSQVEEEYNATYDDFRHLDPDEEAALAMLAAMKKQNQPKYYLEKDPQEEKAVAKKEYKEPKAEVIQEAVEDQIDDSNELLFDSGETISDINENADDQIDTSNELLFGSDEVDSNVETSELEIVPKLENAAKEKIVDASHINMPNEQLDIELDETGTIISNVQIVEEPEEVIKEAEDRDVIDDDESKLSDLEYEALLKKQAMEEPEQKIKNKKEEKKIMEEKKEEYVIDNSEAIDFGENAVVEDDTIDEELPPIVTENNAPETVEKPSKRVARRISASDLQIANINELDTNRDIESLISLPTYQVTAIKSGYSCNIAPLVNADVVSILAETSDQYNQTDKIYKVLFNKIKKFSFETKIDYQTWTKITALDDLETLFYGLYCATYRGISELSITCNKCNNTSTFKVANTTMIHLTNKEKYKTLMDNINREATNFSKVKDFSEISKSETIILDDSGVAVTLKTPTLYDMLSALRYISDDVIKSDESLMNEILYTKEMYIPSKTAGNGKYVTIREPADIARIINNLNINDSNLLSDTISDIINSNTISYAIDKLKCPSCGKEMESAPVSMGDLLFTRIFERL